MKTQFIPGHHAGPGSSLLALAAATATVVGLGSTPLLGQSKNQGSDRTSDDERWYDPGGWFDSDNDRARAGTGPAGNTPGRNQVIDPDDRAARQPSGGRAQDSPGGTLQTGSPRDRNRVTDGRRADRGQMEHNDRWERTSPDRQSQGATTLDGTIDGFQRVNLYTDERGSEQHSFARINLEDGETRIVALGKRLNAADLDLEKGDRIRVSGETARIDNRDVLVANRIEVEDTLFRVRADEKLDQAAGSRTRESADRQAQDSNLRPQARDRDASRRMIDVSGVLEDHQQVSLDRRSEQNLIVRLEMEDGRSSVADLGSNTSLEELNLDEGSQIQIRGERDIVDGRSLIIAHELRVDGETTRLRRPDRENRMDRDRDDRPSVRPSASP